MAGQVGVKLLLDTHALYWWLMGDAKLSSAAVSSIAGTNTTVFVSAVTAFELAYKVRNGKWPEAAELSNRFIETVASEGFVPLAISMEDADLAGKLDTSHRDPFDRLLLAQAELEDLTFVTADATLRSIARASVW